MVLHRLQGGVAEGVRESGEGANEGREGSREGSQVYKGRGVLGLCWVASDVIGWRGRFPWTALWSECRGLGGIVGGMLVWSQAGRFQRGSGRFGSWQGCHSAPRGWAERAS
jgi:hypothetical protein